MRRRTSSCACPNTRDSASRCLEAMNHGLPVVAYAAGAVPDTLGGARDPPSRQVADRRSRPAVHRVGDDGALRGAAGCSRSQRLTAAFDLARTKRQVR